MDRLGEVTKVDGKWLEITFCRPSDCDKCHACMGGSQGQHEGRILVRYSGLLRHDGDAFIGNDGHAGVEAAAGERALQG